MDDQTVVTDGAEFFDGGTVLRVTGAIESYHHKGNPRSAGDRGNDVGEGRAVEIPRMAGQEECERALTRPRGEVGVGTG